MKHAMRVGMVSVGLCAAVAAGVWLLAPAAAIADDDAPDEGGIVISLGEAASLPDGGTEYEVVRWVEDGVEVAPVPDVRVIAAAAE